MPKSLIRTGHTGERARGFSMLEMMLVLALLTIVLGIVMDGMVQMQRRNAAENSKVDAAQETRDFIDQVMTDVHEIGYPPGRVLVGNPSCLNNSNVSCGLVSFSPTQIVYEGDLDGTGTIYTVYVQLVPPTGSVNCPCILRRGVVPKAVGGLPTFFTQVNGVLNSGNGANLNGSGAPTFPISLPGPGTYTAYGTADVFTSYDVNGAIDPVGACGTALACSSIRGLQVTANVAPTFMDPKTKIYPVYSITSRARMNNGCSIPSAGC
jgi:prepilin-type N-terminal cleavage/methylation domain-containing protein